MKMIFKVQNLHFCCTIIIYIIIYNINWILIAIKTLYMGVRGRLTNSEYESVNIDEDIDFDETFEDLSDAQIYESIDKHINELCAYLQLSDKWNQARFDESQRQIVRDSLFHLIKGENIILEAMTGFGKSMYAIFIASYFNNRSFILTSDKMLQAQYEDFIDKVLKKNSANLDLAHKHFAKFQVLRGRDNYHCTQNLQPFSLGTCQENGMSIKQACDTLPCAKKCPYIVARQLAIESQCAVLNYAYWLTLMNITGSNKFDYRGVTIMDECHKLDDVLASFMDISVGPRFIEDCNKAESIIVGMTTTDELNKYIDAKDQLFSNLKELIQSVSSGESFELQREHIRKLVQSADDLFDSLESPVNALQTKIDSNTPLSMFDKALKRFVSKVGELSGALGNLLAATESNITTLLTVLQQDTNSVVFRCTNDELLGRHLVHRHCRRQVFMSATIGDIDSWAKLNGIDNYVGYSIESDWQFKQSAIHICMPLISLSHANIDKNLPELVTNIDEILELHANENGVIHCSTKRIANYICQWSKHKDRVVTYSGTKEKNEVVTKLLVPGNNKVLVAYSATEGISLDDDKCRFQIIAKLSWQNLGDLVIKTKADNNGNWYTLKTLQSLVQAIGRGIRHSEDWCVTYVLDSSFTRLQKSCKFSDAIQKRIVYDDFASAKAQKSMEDDDFFKQFM